MGFFVADSLAIGGSWEGVTGNTWTDVTCNPVWGIADDDESSALLFGSADEGQTWFQIGSIVGSADPGTPTFVTGKPVNALKVTDINGTTGQTLSVQVTGA